MVSGCWQVRVIGASSVLGSGISAVVPMDTNMGPDFMELKALPTGGCDAGDCVGDPLEESSVLPVPEPLGAVEDHGYEPQGC